MIIVGLAHEAARDEPTVAQEDTATRVIGAIATVALAFAIAAWVLAASLGSALAAEVICSGTGTPLVTPHAQIAFNSTSRTCEVSDAGEAPAYGLRAFLLPGFSTPTALGQKIGRAVAVPPSAYTTTWTRA